MTTASSEVIPRERQSAWQRWELASLGSGLLGIGVGLSAEQVAIDVAAAAQRHAQDEARAAGYAEGRAQAATEGARLKELLATLGTTVADHEQHLADEVLDLALVLARQLVGEALAVRRDLLLPIVSAALRQLPQSTQRVEIVLNPADMELVRSFIGHEPLGERAQLVSHAAMAPGGCRIETEQCEVDATIASRWKHLLAALGRSDDWLEPA